MRIYIVVSGRRLLRGVFHEKWRALQCVTDTEANGMPIRTFICDLDDAGRIVVQNDLPWPQGLHLGVALRAISRAENGWFGAVT